MIILNEAKKDIEKIWGKQIPNIEKKYRLMKYILRVGQDGVAALHNVVTGELVGLNQSEVDILNSLPQLYSEEMKELVEKHFLVPEEYDEFQQVINLRKIFRIIEKNNDHKKGIDFFTILPTTGCNAQCYYCFEEGVKPVTMTEKTANKVIDFIASNCVDNRNIQISWYGGEPTVASNRITQICLGLEALGIKYSSLMRTNGYLFDDEMVKAAKEIWHLQVVHITMDGVNDNYRKIKNYKNACQNPYERILCNVGKFIDYGIHVIVRMNFDVINYLDFKLLVTDLKDRFGVNDLLHIYAQPITGERVDFSGRVNHGSEDWFAEKSVELNELVRCEGFKHLNEPDIPHLLWRGCAAESDHYAFITPEGDLGRCLEKFDKKNCIGDIDQGITDAVLKNSWKQLSDLNECKDCQYYPICPKITKCSGCGKCVSHSRNQKIELAINALVENKKENW